MKALEKLVGLVVRAISTHADQEDPVVRWPVEYPNTDAICRNVLTPLVHRFQTDGIQRTRGRSSAEQQQRGEGSQSRASERP